MRSLDHYHRPKHAGSATNYDRKPNRYKLLFHMAKPDQISNTVRKLNGNWWKENLLVTTDKSARMSSLGRVEHSKHTGIFEAV